MERRKFTTQFKQQVVRECIETGNIALVSRKHDINTNVVRRWVKQAEQNGGKIPGTLKGVPTHVTPEEIKQLNAERSELSTEVEQLRKALADQALENSILRDLLKKRS
ncbi:transposase [Alicyclobacillus tolerans]|uniref:transposase n=1 Tax=Alicyclobacillus tolerans TaxID=90970 RepID=UPI003B812553